MKKLIATALVSAALGSAATWAYADKQPKMKEALRHLEKAHDALKAATDDKGGHKVKAVGHINDAITEVKAGIDFDNAH